MTVGYRCGLEQDDTRRNWADDAPRPVAWSAWYPCAEGGTGQPLARQIFEPGDVRVDAPLAGGGPFPVVLMSHGTGGAPEGTGWLAREIARAGYVVIGPHHHGNTTSESYRPEGFLCWWDRATDLSTLLTRLSLEGPFAARLDLDAVSAVGFSLGGYTVLAMAGALTAVDRYRTWALASPGFEGGPREMPNAAARVPELLETSAPFRASWDRQSDSVRDTRLRAAVAIAPAPPVRAFDPASLSAIGLPVTLIVGEADREAPARDCADWLVDCNPDFRRLSAGADVGHYTFLGLPADPAKMGRGPVFLDNPGVDRAAVHRWTAKAVLASLV